MRNEIQIAGPVMSPAVDAVTVKMPAPITTDTPNTHRCHQLRSLRSWVSGSSVSAIDCSIDLVRQRSDHVPGQYRVRWPAWVGTASEITRSSSAPALADCARRGCCRSSTTGSRCSSATSCRADPATAPRCPQGRHVHLLMARGAKEFDGLFPGSARRHGGRRCPDPGEPAGLHLLRRGGPRARHRAHAARRVHRLRPQPPAAGMADPAPGARDSERRDPASLGGAAALRCRRPAGDRGAARQRRRRARLRRRRSGDRRRRTRHPVAGLAGAVGLSAAAGENRRRGHRLCVATAPVARGRDPRAGGRRRGVARAAGRAGPAGLRGRHLDADHLRCRESRTAAYAFRRC